jgi:hypothetical protein
MEMLANGARLEDIAEATGLSKGRVSAISARMRQELTEEATRDVQRSQLEYVLHDVLYPLLRGPGKRVISPSGRPVFELDEHGDPDYSRPVFDEYAKTDVVLAFIRTQERYSKLLALDMKKAAEDQTAEIAEAMAYVQQLQAENKALRRQSVRKMVEAEIISRT